MNLKILRILGRALGGLRPIRPFLFVQASSHNSGGLGKWAFQTFDKQEQEMLVYLGLLKDEPEPITPKREVIVSISLSSAVYCAGDCVRGSAEISFPEDVLTPEVSMSISFPFSSLPHILATEPACLQRKPAVDVDLVLELRLHGHIRVDRRWVPLVQPIRKAYGQTSTRTGSVDDGVLPPFPEVFP